MNRREIPGQYFDEEKNKFFKIIPDHQSTEPGSKYTASWVAQKNVSKQRAKLEEQRAALEKTQKIKRSSLASVQAFGPASLGLEVNNSLSRAASAHDTAKAVAGTFNILHTTPHPRLQHSPTFPGDPSCVVYDQHSDVVFSGRRIHGGSVLSAQHLRDFPIWRIANAPKSSFSLGQTAIPYTISTLNISPSRLILVVTQGFGEPSTTSCVCKIDDAHGRVGQPPLLDFSLSHNARFTELSRAAASNHHLGANESGTLFAIGAGPSAFVLPSIDADFSTGMDLSANIRSMAFLSRNVLASGCEDGYTRLWDMRGDAAVGMRFDHGFPKFVTEICPIDENYIALQGNEVLPALYDLRMTSSAKSKPVLEYARGTPQQDCDGGMDVHAPSGLVAYGTYNGIIHLCKLWTGELLRDFDLEKRGQTRFLKFAADGSRGLSLLGCHESTEFKLEL